MWWNLKKNLYTYVRENRLHKKAAKNESLTIL